MSRGVLVTISLFFCVIGSFYLAFLHYAEPTQVGIVRNWVSGELRIDTPGWNFTLPWVSVAKIDVRPMRVCVTTAGRGFNCKLVQFEPSKYREFVGVEGFHYYWWANRISINTGYDEEYRGVKDLLRGYAYSTKHYPFVTVLRDFEESQ